MQHLLANSVHNGEGDGSAIVARMSLISALGGR
jgi:hypothetical protein